MPIDKEGCEAAFLVPAVIVRDGQGETKGHGKGHDDDGDLESGDHENHLELLKARELFENWSRLWEKGPCSNRPE